MFQLDRSPRGKQSLLNTFKWQILSAFFFSLYVPRKRTYGRMSNLLLTFLFSLFRWNSSNWSILWHWNRFFTVNKNDIHQVPPITIVEHLKTVYALSSPQLSMHSINKLFVKRICFALILYTSRRNANESCAPAQVDLISFVNDPLNMLVLHFSRNVCILPSTLSIDFHLFFSISSWPIHLHNYLNQSDFPCCQSIVHAIYSELFLFL